MRLSFKKTYNVSCYFPGLGYFLHKRVAQKVLHWWKDTHR